VLVQDVAEPGECPLRLTIVLVGALPSAGDEVEVAKPAFGQGSAPDGSDAVEQCPRLVVPRSRLNDVDRGARISAAIRRDQPGAAEDIFPYRVTKERRQAEGLGRGEQLGPSQLSSCGDEKAVARFGLLLQLTKRV
jgi:hypothetical protein